MATVDRDLTPFEPLAPSIEQTTVRPFGAQLDTAALQAAQLEVVFVHARDAQDAQLLAIEAAGVPAIALNGDTFEAQDQLLALLAQVYGNAAKAKQQAYTQEVNKQRNALSKYSSRSQEQRVKVLAVWPLDDGTLRLPKAGDWICQMIELAGGTCVMVEADVKEYTVKQALQSDPDVILNLDEKRLSDKLMQNQNFVSMRAVKGGKFFTMPRGFAHWALPNLENPLTLQYLASILNAQDYDSLDLKTILQAYYLDYFGYTLTDSEALLRLRGELPIIQ